MTEKSGEYQESHLKAEDVREIMSFSIFPVNFLGILTDL